MMFHFGGEATWLPSELDLHHSDIKRFFAQGLKPVLAGGTEVITLYHHDNDDYLCPCHRMSLEPADSHRSEFQLTE